MKTKKILAATAIALAAGLLALHHGKTGEPIPMVTHNTYTVTEVVNVVDGDTVDIEFKIWSNIKLTERLRFDGFDAWELRSYGTNKISEDHKQKGIAAKAALERLLQGKHLFLRTDQKRGKYGRLIGTLEYFDTDEVRDVRAVMTMMGHEKKSEF